MPSRLLLFALALVALVGCESTPSGPDRTSQPIMNLKVGNAWIGRSFALDSAGNAVDIAYDTLRITDMVVIGSETWYVGDDGVQYADRSDGLWMRFPSGGRTVHAAKHPASVGEIFGRDTFALTNQSGQITDTLVASLLVDGVGTSLTVGASSYLVNTYETITETLQGRRLGSSEQGWSGDEYSYATNVGLVRLRMYSRDGILARTWELVEFREG